MQIGVLLPQYDPNRWPDALGAARDAEAGACDSVWLEDHLLVRTEDEAGGPWECWTMAAAVAASTSRVAIGTLVSSTAYRPPALLAKMAATVHEISGGRTILGLGAGWYLPDYEAYGYPTDHRIGRFAEALPLVRSLIHGERVTHDGPFYRLEGCELLPRIRHEPPPILVGGRGPRMLDLVVRHADAWNVWATWDEGRPVESPQTPIVDALCAGVGRDPADLLRTRAVAIRCPGAETDEGVPAERILTGPAAEVAASLASLADLGVAHVQVMLIPNVRASLTWFLDVVEILRR